MSTESVALRGVVCNDGLVHVIEEKQRDGVEVPWLAHSLRGSTCF